METKDKNVIQKRLVNKAEILKNAAQAEKDLRNDTDDLMFMDRSKIPAPDVQENAKWCAARNMDLNRLCFPEVIMDMPSPHSGKVLSSRVNKVALSKLTLKASRLAVRPRAGSCNAVQVSKAASFYASSSS
jgi:hypothetical protein